jgi:hypothetical protein
MKALTLTQPWSSLCVAPDPDETWRAVKPIETRSWRLLQKHLPLRLAIHAAAGITREVRDLVSERSRTGPGRVFRGVYREALLRAGLPVVDPWSPTSSPGHGSLALGAIVGAVTVVGCAPTDQIAAEWRRGEVSNLVFALGDFSPGRWAWVFTQPVIFERPLACKGAQGLWTVPGPVAVDVEERDRAARAMADVRTVNEWLRARRGEVTI